MKIKFLFIILSPIILSINTNGIRVEGSKLLNADGKEIILNGVNLAHAWYTDKTEFSIKEILALGVNSARTVLAYGAKWNKTPITEVENIINWCEKEGLI